jgi:hypothetical protein
MPAAYKNAGGDEYLMGWAYEKSTQFSTLAQRSSTSSELRRVVEEIEVNLQIGIEAALAVDPNMSRGALQAFALDNHSDAYRDGGFWNLGLIDQGKIALTIGPRDFVRAGGVKEAAESFMAPGVTFTDLLQAAGPTPRHPIGQR